MKIVCLGDSLTYGYGVRRREVWTALLEKKLKIEVINKGISGDTSAGMLSRLYNDVILEKPSYAMVMGGTNDFIWNLPVEQVMANIASIVFQIMHNSIKPLIGLPVPVCVKTAADRWGFMGDFQNVNKDLEKFNDCLKKFCKNYNIKIFDFYCEFAEENGYGKEGYYIDGIHLNSEGNKRIADMIFI
ncbi:GDSL-type esterase/lipase family protein [Clostridium sp. WILCCON 0269]|uniref:GDSL-type esterase/lipase family protein n=1 Tax=Candidatus Clostridium eludens TaxID=3381663 RepID=A0ABW8SND7_9CLOT